MMWATLFPDVSYASGVNEPLQEFPSRVKTIFSRICPRLCTLGMKEEAIHYLQLAYEEHSPRLIHMQYEPDFDFLHTDERFREIVQKVGLPRAF